MSGHNESLTFLGFCGMLCVAGTPVWCEGNDRAEDLHRHDLRAEPGGFRPTCQLGDKGGFRIRSS